MKATLFKNEWKFDTMQELYLLLENYTEKEREQIWCETLKLRTKEIFASDNSIITDFTIVEG